MSPKSPGRPPLNDVSATERIIVRVTPAQRLDLRRVATDNGTDVSGIVREAVNEYVSDYDERRVFPRRRR
jgi:hypothetical protein